MRRDLSIICDVDGVLADFTGAVRSFMADFRGTDPGPLTTWNLRDGWNLTGGEKQYLNKLTSAKGFAQKLSPLPGAEKFLRELRKLGDVIIVTSPWRSSPYWIEDRNAWLKKHGAEGLPVIHTEHKWAVRGHVIIDDKPEHVVSVDRRLCILVPNAANAAWRNNDGMTMGHIGRVFISKSHSRILQAIREIE